MENFYTRRMLNVHHLHTRYPKPYRIVRQMSATEMVFIKLGGEYSMRAGVFTTGLRTSVSRPGCPTTLRPHPRTRKSKPPPISIQYCPFPHLSVVRRLQRALTRTPVGSYSNNQTFPDRKGRLSQSEVVYYKTLSDAEEQTIIVIFFSTTSSKLVLLRNVHQTCLQHVSGSELL